MNSKADVASLSKLCRIKCTAEESAQFQRNLEKILSYMQLIEDVDTTDTPPCRHVLETIENVMDADEPRTDRGGGMDPEDFLKNAPSQVGRMIKVPPILQAEE